MFKNQLLKNKKPSMGLSGRYRFVVGDVSTRRVRIETDWSENLILNAGLNRLGVGANNRITGVEYLDAAAAAAPVTVTVTGITPTQAIRYDIGDLSYGPVFSTFLSNRIT